MRFPKLVVLLLLLSLSPVFAAELDSLKCDVEKHVDTTNPDAPYVRIVVRLPLPALLRRSVYFDTILMRRRPDGKWFAYLSNGHEEVDYIGMPENADEVKKAVERFCPGQSGAVDQSLHASSSSARKAVVPPVSGAAATFSLLEDLDGDGNPDVALVDGNLLYVSLMDANGKPRSEKSYAAPPDAAYLVAADFNGDSKLDLVASSTVTNPVSGAAWIFFNTGSGDFEAGQSLRNNAGALATGDFNQDGKVDLLIGTDTGFRRMTGSGLGTFPDNDGVALAIRPNSLVAADFNGDGRLDVAGIDRFSNTIALRYGNGNGTFQGGFTSEGGGPVGDLRGHLAYSDLNHDGNLDLLIRYAYNHQLSLLLGNANGTFQTAKNYVAPGDSQSLSVTAYEDGQFLILMLDRVTGSIVNYIAPGNGTINAPRMERAAASVMASTAGDFDGDGDDDLALATDDNKVVLRRNVSGVLQPGVNFSLPDRPIGAAATDLNGDQRADLIVTLRNGSVAVLLGNSNGTLGNATTFAAGTSPALPQLADFNRDGKTDLAVVPRVFSGSTGQISVLLGNGQGGFGVPTGIATGAGDITGIVAGNFNADQNPDIVVTTVTGGGFGAGNLVLFRGQGDGTFLAPQTISPLTASYALTAGDFNGDNKLDLAVATGGITTRLGNGDGTFGAPATTLVETTATDLQVADLNGDGVADLVNNACCGATLTTYLLGYGNGGFAEEHLLAAPHSPSNAVIADLNGDDRPDVALGGVDGYYTVNYLEFPALLVVNSAGAQFRVTAESIASAYGPHLASKANPNGTTVTVKDSSNVSRDAFIFFSSPGLVNFAVPAGTALGEATITVRAADGFTSSTMVRIEAVVPGLYVLNADQLVAANVARVRPNETVYEDIFQLSNGAIVAKPVNMGPENETIFLILYGTGLRSAGKEGTTVTVGGVPVTVEYAGLQGSYPGFDQVNIRLPRSLIGRGTVQLVLTANGQTANVVTFVVQ